MFDGEGTQQGKLILEVDDSVPDAGRKPPLALREKYKNELERLCSINVITPLTEPSDWISSTVIVPKQNGDIRVRFGDPDHDRVLRTKTWSGAKTT